VREKNSDTEPPLRDPVDHEVPLTRASLVKPKQWAPDRPLWDRMAKGPLIKAFWLIVLLGSVFWFQSKATSCATTFTQTIAPPPSPAEQQRSEGRTVRMAPLLGGPKATSSSDPHTGGADEGVAPGPTSVEEPR